MELCMRNVFRDLKDTKKDDVEAVQVFKRMKALELETWNARRAASTPSAPSKATVETKSRDRSSSSGSSSSSSSGSSSCKTMSGSWELDTSANDDDEADTEAFRSLGVMSGMPKSTRIASSADMKTVTVIEKVGSGVSVSHLYRMGAATDKNSPRSTLLGRTYVEKAFWQGNSLVVEKYPHPNGSSTAPGSGSEGPVIRISRNVATRSSWIGGDSEYMRVKTEVLHSNGSSNSLVRTFVRK
jgi:hypothetical protein